MSVARGWTCIFCGSEGPLTGEHLWSEWLQELLDPKARKTPVSHRAGSTFADFDDRQFDETPFTEKVNEVCGPRCNHRSMSALEGAAKPLLIPMILGQPSTFDLTDQEILSRWIAKTAMVYQRTTKHRAIRPNQYRYLALNLQPAGRQVRYGSPVEQMRIRVHQRLLSESPRWGHGPNQESQVNSSCRLRGIW